MNTEKLKTISKTETGKRIFDFLSTYKNKVEKTPVKSLEAFIVSQIQIKETLKALEDAGVGKLISKGRAPRMKWFVPIQDLVQIRNEAQTPQPDLQDLWKLTESVLKQTADMATRLERLEKWIQPKNDPSTPEQAIS